MGIRGPTVQLKGIARKLAETSKLVTSGDMSRVLAETARDLVDEGFAESKAPDGTPWAPLSMRDGQPLRDTRRLQSSFTYQTNARGFELGTNVEYAAIHQFGGTITPKRAKRLRFAGPNGAPVFASSVRIPARPMLPKTVSPNSPWGRVLKQAADDLVMQVSR